MCSLFGVIKLPADIPAPSSGATERSVGWRKAALAFEGLGYLAQERGQHASGFAFFVGRTQPHAATALLDTTLAKSSVRVDGWWVSKAPHNFQKFWTAKLTEHRLGATQAGVLIGHTRRATRGNRHSLLNASPLLIGKIIGTHNGGVAMRELIDAYHLPPAVGETSSEVIFQVLNQLIPPPSPSSALLLPKAKTKEAAAFNSEANPNPTTLFLEQLRGRAALAWVDRNRPRTVYLARTALSPLAIAFDSDGNAYWASNPAWFERLDQATDGFFGFRDITPLVEGTLLTLRAIPAKGAIELTQPQSFQPYVRPDEAKLFPEALFRGFEDAQLLWEEANVRHQVRSV